MMADWSWSGQFRKNTQESKDLEIDDCFKTIHAHIPFG